MWSMCYLKSLSFRWSSHVHPACPQSTSPRISSAPSCCSRWRCRIHVSCRCNTVLHTFFHQRMWTARSHASCSLETLQHICGHQSRPTSQRLESCCLAIAQWRLSHQARVGDRFLPSSHVWSCLRSGSRLATLRFPSHPTYHQPISLRNGRQKRRLGKYHSHGLCHGPIGLRTHRLMNEWIGRRCHGHDWMTKILCKMLHLGKLEFLKFHV